MIFIVIPKIDSRFKLALTSNARCTHLVHPPVGASARPTPSIPAPVLFPSASAVTVRGPIAESPTAPVANVGAPGTTKKINPLDQTLLWKPFFWAISEHCLIAFTYLDNGVVVQLPLLFGRAPLLFLQLGLFVFLLGAGGAARPRRRVRDPKLVGQFEICDPTLPH